MMTRKDFEAVAKVLLQHDAYAEAVDATFDDGAPGREQERVGAIARNLCGVFARSNPAFDRDRFLRAALTSDNPMHPDNTGPRPRPFAREAAASASVGAGESRRQACECGAPWNPETGGYSCAD